MHPLHRRSRRGAQRAVLAALAVLAGCSDRQPTGPAAPAPPVASRAAGAQSDDAPFYYYQTEKVMLEVDPTTMVVASDLPDAASAAVQAVAAAGIHGARAERMSYGHNLLLLRLPMTTERAAALAARARLRSDPRFTFATTGYVAARERTSVLPLDRVAVKFRSGTTPEQIAALSMQLGTRTLRTPNRNQNGVYLLGYPRGADPLAVAAVLDENPLVEWADPDKAQERHRMYVPTDPFYSQQFYLKNTITLNGYRVDDNVENAWEITTGQWAPSSGGFQVAVIDDGVEMSHPDFNGHVTYGGYDAWGYTGYATSPQYSTDMHGTKVAGVIVGQHNNGAGVAGIAPGVYIRSIRIFRGTEAATDVQIGDAINFAWSVGSQVLSNSWGGGPPSNAVTDAIHSAVTQGRGGKGAVVVFAAGNTSQRSIGNIGSVSYPGNLSDVITVSAINRNGALTDYAPEGPEIDLVAPSGHYTGHCTGEVVTTDRLSTNGCNDGPGGNIDYTSTFSGTSAAAPQVAAAAALLLAQENTLTVTDVKNRLYTAATPWGSANQFGRGKLDVYKTLMGSFYTGISGTNWIDTNGTYTWTATPSGGNGVYSYQWQYSSNGTSFSNVGTNSPTYSRYVSISGGLPFWIRVNVTSVVTTATATRKVIVDDGICSPGELC
ncbi:MAG: S8 family serine peptidase [Longimicrobiaceae bacterium]